jgi:hypothetical protein
MSWDALFRSGAVIDLHVSMWRARTGIKISDLAIEDSDEVHKALALGSHRLAPRNALDKIREIAAKAKRTIEYHSVTFPYLYGVRFVPDQSLEILLEKLPIIADEFDAEADSVAGRLGEVKEEMAPVVMKAIKDATRNPDLVQAAFDRVMSEYPTPDEVRRRFSLRWKIFTIQGSKSAAVADAASEETEDVKSVVRDIITQLRAEISDKVGAVMAAVARGGKIPQPSVDSAMAVIDRVEQMNVFGDSVLTAQVATLRRVVEAAVGDDGMDPTDMVSDLVGVKKALDSSVEQAVEDAKKNLTAVGRRKLSVPRPKKGVA